MGKTILNKAGLGKVVDRSHVMELRGLRYGESKANLSLLSPAMKLAMCLNKLIRFIVA